MLMACSGMAGDWGWRKERYPLNAIPLLRLWFSAAIPAGEDNWI
jgi:hypothetical protein